MLPVMLSVGSDPPWHRPWDGDRELLREAGDSHGVTGGSGGSLGSLGEASFPPAALAA